MMRTIRLIIRHEVTFTLRQRSFWILTLLLPAVIIAVQLVGLTFGDDEVAGSEVLEGEASDSTIADFPVLGLVDEGGFVAQIPPELPATLFIRFDTEEAAREALRAGDLDQVVIVPADYLDTGEVTALSQDFVFTPAGSEQSVAFGNYEWVLQYVLEYNLEPDPVLLAAIRNPTPGMLATFVPLNQESAGSARDEDSQGVAQAVSTVVPFIYYFLLIMGSSYLMGSVIKEKENRTAEVLLLSLPPRQLVFGKMIAMLILILIQVAIWLGAMYLFLDQRETIIAMAGNFALPAGFALWAILFLIAGYAMYGAFLAAGGALASTSRETQQIVWVLIIPLMPTLIFASEFAAQPPNALAVFLSLFPLTAPSAMVTRIAVGNVPLWQILLSLAGVTITAYLALMAAARFFRPDTLLSTEVFSWKRVASEWRRS